VDPVYVGVDKLTVKLATVLQMGAVQAERRQLHSAFVQEALGLPPSDADIDAFCHCLKRAWRTVRWENHHKEVLWRLALDGVPLRGNSHVQGPPAACVCGAQVSPTPRVHHFWSCAIAQAVIVDMAQSSHAHITREGIWLLQPPAGVQECVWFVVCMAALTAMEQGRRHARALVKRGQAAGAAARASAHAVAAFWGRLSNFVALGAPPKGWTNVPAAHPFIGVAAGDRLVLNRPV
jgi:hypothetical protein